MKAVLVTIVQFVCIFWILLTNSWLASPPIFILIQAFGGFLGLWAILIMSKSKLNVTPVPREGSFLVNTGPYRLLRHPMYTSLILSLFPLLIANHGLENIVVYTVLLCNQLIKLNYEEELLKKKFSNYPEFMKGTWKLIPWVY